MYDLQDATTHEIGQFLSKQLPYISENWWQDMVLAVLNPRQKDNLLKSEDRSLSVLDLGSSAEDF